MDKEALLAPRLVEEDFELPGLGTIRIRPLTRSEALRLHNAGDIRTKEAQMLSWGIVDPVLTIAEVNQWLDVAPAGEVQELSERIGIISGMFDGAAKTVYKSNGSEPGSRV